ncbi:hypothetical protein LSH36_46g01016 [Paralvinella palmiformis]|uniref:Uncharacterized protein n=1 Tax=Paralvinella palmiformis TaxID=53620 RepID=A0AAD9K6H6_9ANNE|nr:hypothetical protein LSH36_46g01016 [Paralvinella palmiformis]
MVDGLHAIIITDRDGVPVLKVADEHLPHAAMQPRLLATAAMAVEQANKLGVSNNKNIITVYKNHQLISINRQPLIVNMIANANANTGLILSLEADMQEPLDDICAALELH